MLRVALLVFALLTPFHVAKADAPIPVVATFSILGDLVKNVGGERITLDILVGANGDAHSYAPKPSDVKTLARAKIVFANGLGFERWLARLIETSATDRRVTVSDGVSVRTLPGDVPDPHAWQSVGNTRVYVANIRDALVAADPAGKATYESQAAAYLVQLDALDSEIRTTLSRIPETKRRAVTSHPSFGYFGDAYGISFTSPQVLGNEAEASAKSVAAMIDAIRRDKISAIFVESAGDARLIHRIAAETGIAVGGALYSDALTDASGPAPTYLTMMRQNLRTIEAALRD